MATKTELAWMAGIVDGEGCIRFGKHWHNVYKAYTYMAMMRVKMSSEPAIRELLRVSGVGAVNRTKGWKGRQMWVWRASAKQIRRLLPLIRPYLVVKAREADLVIKAMEAAAAMPRGNRHKGPNLARRAILEGFCDKSRELKGLG